MDRVSWNFIFGYFLKICREKLKFHSYQTRITSTLHEDQYIFWVIFRSILHGVRNVSEKCRENQNKHFMLNNIFFFENRAFMW